MEFESYRNAVRSTAEELTRTHPTGFVLIVSVDNTAKGSVAGVVSEVRCFDAARHIIDGTARVMGTTTEGGKQ